MTSSSTVPFMAMPGAAHRSFAIVTPSYWRDLGRCELLTESLDRCCPDVMHYLIVDRRDIPAFAHLRGSKREIIESEALIGKWLRRLPGSRGYWVSGRSLPVRGWIAQQLKKIAVISAVREQTLVFCDSDVAFLRRFTHADLLVNGKVGLLDVSFVDDNVRRWTRTAARLVGINDDIQCRNHVGYVICWNRETVLALQQRIAETAGLDWPIALTRLRTFSEYMLYGVFVRCAAGYDTVDHAPSDVPLVEGAWHLSSAIGVEKFFQNFDPRTVAVMIHSKDGVDPSTIRPHLERYWRELE